jgi:hypothetical protein
MKGWRMCGEPAAVEREVRITLTEKDAVLLQQATGEVPSLLNHAGAVFRLLWSIEAGGYAQGHTGIVSLYELCARAFESAAEKEGVEVDRLDCKLRSAIANLGEEQCQKKATAEDEAKQRIEEFASRWVAQGNRNPDEEGA